MMIRLSSNTKRTRIVEEEEGKALTTASTVALTQEQQRLAALEVELAKAKAEVEKLLGGEGG